jgi:hypothetical protein
MKAHRAIFWVLVLAFILLSCWWVFYFPFRPGLVCRAIPPAATIVTRHLEPADRWMGFAHSPAVTNIAAVLGADEGQIAGALDSGGVATAVGILGSRYVATGIVPSLGARCEKAFVFAAWVGGYSQLLRWGLLDRALGDFTVHRLKGNLRLWFRSCHEIKPGYTLSLTVHEGVLVGCLSAEPLGVLYVLPRLQRQAPVAGLLREWCDDAVDAELPDAFRARIDLPREAGRMDLTLRGGLTEMSAERLAARAEIETPIDASGSGNGLPFKPAGEDITGAEAPALGAAPSMLVATPVSRVDSLIGAWPDGPLLRTWPKLREVARPDGNAYLFACGDRYYGRLMRMKVPSFGLAVAVSEEADGDAVVRGVLDVLNAAHGWGLIATPDTADPRIRVLDSVRGGSFKRLGADERPAIAVSDGWLIAMSSVSVLRRMLAEAGGADGRAWVEALNVHAAALSGWADLGDSSDLMMKALAGYTLVSLMQSGSAPPPRYDTAQVKAMIKAIGQLGQFAFWLQPGDASSLVLAEVTLAE